jgi:hypothetical protein
MGRGRAPSEARWLLDRPVNGVPAALRGGVPLPGDDNMENQALGTRHQTKLRRVRDRHDNGAANFSAAADLHRL